MKNKFKINEKAVRAAITTLFKNRLVKHHGWDRDDFANDKMTIVINVNSDLLMSKKKFTTKSKNAHKLIKR